MDEPADLSAARRRRSAASNRERRRARRAELAHRRELADQRLVDEARIQRAARNAAWFAARRAKRLRNARIILVAAAGLSALAVVGAALIAARYDGDSLRWWYGVGGRYTHAVDYVLVPKADAASFAFKVTAAPVLLAAVSWGLLHVPRTGDGFAVMLPAWVAAWFAPGLAVGVVLSFVATAVGQTGLPGDDFLPALASVAPEGLPVLAFLAAAPFLVLRARRTQRRAGR